MTEIIIPAGYREDSRGNLIPEANIKEVDLARDEFVREMFSRAKELNGISAGARSIFWASLLHFANSRQKDTA